MPSIALSGLSTGIDTSLIVSQLVAAARTPITQLEQRKSRLRQKSDAFTDLGRNLESLRTALDDLRSAADLRACQARSSDETVLTVEAASSGAEGSHEIIVDRLARADRKVHLGLASADALVGEGTFSYTYNGTTRTIQTTDDTTLEDLRDLINNDSGNSGVTASLLEYDAGEDHVYHLVLAGNDTGADYAIAINDAQTTLEAFQSASFTTTQAAQNSRIRVDGYPAGAWIERSANTIDDVLPGVTLHLVGTGTVQVGLTRDTTDLVKKIKGFVDAYNAVVSQVRAKSAYDAASRTGGPMMGEYTATHVLAALRAPLVETLTGFKDGQDAFTLAAQIGLSIDRYGSLSFKETAPANNEVGFDEAVADNYLGVLALLGADRTGASDSQALAFYGARESTTPGTYNVRVTFTDGVPTAAWMKKADEPESAWRVATIDGNLVIGATGQAEQNLQVTASYSGTGTVEAEVRVRQGLAGRLYDAVDNLLETDGPIDLTKDRCQSAIDMIQANIDREEARVARLQQQLTLQFARLEEALTLLQAQQGALGMFRSK